MPINYNPVGWDTTKFVNPTNMNQMDNGIKAACDGVDELNTEVDKVNESLTIVYDAPSGYTINQVLSMIASYVPVAQTRLFRASISGGGGHYSGFMCKINDVAITGHMVLNNPQSSYRFNRDSEAVWTIEELASLDNMTPKLIATAESGQTYKSQCSALYEAYKKLSIEQQMRSFVRFGNIVFQLSNVGNGYFNYTLVTNEKISVQSILLSNSLLYTSDVKPNGTTITNLSESTAQAQMLLYTHY